MVPRYDLVLMDADRTLFDFDRSEQEAIRLTLKRHGLPAGEETVQQYLAINQSLWEAFDRGEFPQDRLGRERFARLLALLGDRTQDPDELNQAYLSMLGSLPYLLPGAEALCKRLAPFCRLVIVTNGLTVAQTGRLEHAAIRPYIDRMYISQALGCQKPERAFFDRVFADLGVDEAGKAGTVLLGDSLTSDIQGGINAGIDTIWLNKDGKKCPESMKITYIVPCLEEVSDIILPR